MKTSSLAMLHRGYRAVGDRLPGSSASKNTERAGEYLDDLVITTKVRAALLEEPSSRSFQFGVRSRTDIVQLSAFVDSTQGLRLAEEVAPGVHGASTVRNTGSPSSAKALAPTTAELPSFQCRFGGRSATPCTSMRARSAQLHHVRVEDGWNRQKTPHRQPFGGPRKGRPSVGRAPDATSQLNVAGRPATGRQQGQRGDAGRRLGLSPSGVAGSPVPPTPAPSETVGKGPCNPAEEARVATPRLRRTSVPPCAEVRQQRVLGPNMIRMTVAHGTTIGLG
jgi:hypothetical protein